MCFSATGSFIAGAVNATAGAAALHRTAGTRESVLAAFPLAFAVQQTMEGVLWLEIPGHAAAAPISAVANDFVFLALVVWPVLAPFVALLLEKDQFRRKILIGLLGLGAAYAGYSGFLILSHPFGARILGHSILYSNGLAFPLTNALLYCVCTCVPLLLSTQYSMKLLGLSVLMGLAVSYALFFYTFLSVWCFFAALASGVVFFRAYFEVPQLAQRRA